jgi:CRP-like cAMP-binding protein
VINAIAAHRQHRLSQFADIIEMGSGLRASHCRQATFGPGDLLRERRQHYSDMYVITSGTVGIDLEAGEGAPRRTCGPGSPIGEIGFLRGCPATATVAAETAVEAVVVDDATFAQFHSGRQTWHRHVRRLLTEIAEECVSSKPPALGGPSDQIEVYLCRNSAMLESAQRLRYQVYVGELGRTVRHADHTQGLIEEELDHCGDCFIAVENGETVGTLRLNLSSRGALGPLEEIYGMTESPHHPKATAISTKFMVRKSRRGSSASIELLAAAGRYLIRNGIKEIYFDSIPSLVRWYQAFGSFVLGPTFEHPENGPSYPMMRALS